MAALIYESADELRESLQAYAEIVAEWIARENREQAAVYQAAYDALAQKYRDAGWFVDCDLTSIGPRVLVRRPEDW